MRPPKTIRFVMDDGTIKYYDASGRDVHIDAPLSEILINYRPAGSVADQIFPVVPVVHQSDVFYEFSQADLWRVENSERAPLTAAKRVDFNVTSLTYYARNYAYGTAFRLRICRTRTPFLPCAKTRA